MIRKTTAVLLVIAILGWLFWIGAMASFGTRIAELESEVETLRTEVIFLSGRISEASEIIHLGKSEILDKAKTVVAPPRGEIFLRYDTPYVGYIEINFTSTQPVSFRFANGRMNYWIYYPVQPIAEIEVGSEVKPGQPIIARIVLGALESGTFQVPTLPPYTVIYIDNPNDTNANMTFTATYVY